MTEPVVIEARTLRVNPEYIRGKTDQNHVRIMADVLEDAKGQWPFPPIQVQAIPISEEKLIKEGGRYWIIDGHHRVEAAALTGKKVHAICHDGLTPVEAISMQVSENAKNGMALDVKARQRALLALQKAGLNTVEIAKRTSLTRSTVSRVLSGKAGTKAGTAEDKRKGAKPKGSKPFDTEKWLKLLGKVLEGFNKHRRKIEKTKGYPDDLSKALDKVIDIFQPETE